MTITQRQAILGLLVVQTAGSYVLGLVRLFTTPDAITGLIAIFAVLYTVLLVIYYRTNAMWVRYLNAVFMIVSVALGATAAIDLTFLVIPILLLLVVDSPFWLIGAACVMITAWFLAGGRLVFAEYATDLVIYGVGVLALIINRSVTITAQRHAEQQSARAEAALAEAETARQHLQMLNAELQATNVDQLQLLQLISTLEMPAVTIADGTVLVPIIGHLDSRRAGDLNTHILELVHRQHIQLVVLDLAGIVGVDTHVARAVNDMTLAIRLLGARVVVTSISAEAALLFSQLNIQFARTARSPQDALAGYRA